MYITFKQCNMNKNVIIGILSILCTILIMIIINKPSVKTDIKLIPVKEIVEVKDTVRINKHTIVTNTKDTFIYVPTTSIDTFNDTIKIPIIIESKAYLDTIDTDTSSTIINVNYEGYMAKINSIKLQHKYFNKETTITKQNRVSFGATIGAGIGYGQYVDVKEMKTGQGILMGGFVGIGLTIKF